MHANPARAPLCGWLGGGSDSDCEMEGERRFVPCRCMEFTRNPHRRGSPLPYHRAMTSRELPTLFRLARCFSLSSLLALALVGCDCDPPTLATCTTRADCASGQVCVDRVCVASTDSGAPDGEVLFDAPYTDAPFDDAARVLVIEPADPVIDADGTPQSLTLTARLGSTTLDSVSWVLSDVVLGTLSGSGEFTANGLTAGQVRVTARYGELEAQTTLTVRVRITQLRDGLSDADVALLRAGGSADGGHRWLYPYDETVFPRGLASPVFQLGGSGADAVRLTVDIEERAFHYEGFFGPSSPVQVELPREVWDAITESAGAGHAVVVGATKIAAGAASGPATETLRIAQGRLTGSIYYNTYYSPLASGGAILRVPLGRDAEVVQAGCTVCHSVSANGNRIATGLSWSDSDTITGTGNPVRSGNIELAPDGTATAGYSDRDGRKYSFGALTPDGSLLLNNAVPPSGGIRGLSGTLPSRLYDASTGAEIAVPSWSDIVQYAVTPQFAADGSGLAFTWFPSDGSHNGRTLAVSSFDASASPPLFGAPRRVVTITDTARILGWPAFTPDGRAVVYQNATSFDTSLGAGAGRSNTPVWSDLHLVDLASCDDAGENCTVSNLETLNGYREGGFYPPYGEGEEAHSNYEPTFLPVAVGGYYWVVFTSRRCYGNTIAPGGTLAGGEDRWGHTNAGGGEVPSMRKKLWIAAIDLSGAPGSDRSHPAFYLSGQELASGNMRGFAALDPCRADGASCESAADCCGGFCRDVSEDGMPPVFACVPPPGGCSEELESCDSDADCCGAASGTRCINHRCAAPSVD